MYQFRSTGVSSGRGLCRLVGGSSPPASSRHASLAHRMSPLVSPEPLGGYRCCVPVPDQFRWLPTRSLIVETLAAQPVRLERLSGSDSGIVELKLDRPEAKNAISKDVLRAIRSSLESVNGDSSVNVMMVCSSVPRVFCAGADLKGPQISCLGHGVIARGLKPWTLFNGTGEIWRLTATKLKSRKIAIAYV